MTPERKKGTRLLYSKDRKKRGMYQMLKNKCHIPIHILPAVVLYYYCFHFLPSLEQILIFKRPFYFVFSGMIQRPGSLSYQQNDINLIFVQFILNFIESLTCQIRKYRSFVTIRYLYVNARWDLQIMQKVSAGIIVVLA